MHQQAGAAAKVAEGSAEELKRSYVEHTSDMISGHSSSSFSQRSKKNIELGNITLMPMINEGVEDGFEPLSPVNDGEANQSVQLSQS